MATKTKAAAKPKAAAKVVKKPAKAVKAKAATKTAAKGAKAQATVTLRNLSDAIAATHELPKKQANAMLSEMVDMIATHLKKGARIRIGGLGILQVRSRPARMGRNPATGEQIKIKASKKIAFRAAKELKEAV
ncbi:MAG: HU family DNA-binding protein [Hyphomicrobiaceae bacterium]